MTRLRTLCRATALIAAPLLGIAGAAAFPLKWEAATTVNIGDDDFAPYYIVSNRYGTLTQATSLMENGKLWKEMDFSRRFDYGFGAEIYAAIPSSTDYMRYDAATGETHINSQHPAYAWLQQIWGEVKYRSLFAYVGMKNYDRSIFNNTLGVGDITLGTNARPIPQVRLGFTDFVDVPFTNGWLQVQGELAYGKFADSNWLKDHYNYEYSFITTGTWFHYKRWYFRTNPSARFSATIGLQHAAQFGGIKQSYKDGVMTAETSSSVRFRDFVDVFVQKKGGSGSSTGDTQYYNGNHLGSWDVKLTYRFHDNSTLTATLQSPWEDGSGIGKLNGWDGVWGLEYSTGRKGWLTDAAAQYIDFTNQSGPMHWAPDDHNGTQINGNATGADDYYNNYFYNGWMNHGMSLGTPFVKSPIYNLDGYMRFTDNRVRGFQIGVAGTPSDIWSYRAMVSWRKSWGTPFIPAATTRENTSAMVEVKRLFPSTPGLWATGQVAMDAGKLYGNRFGVCFTVGYTGNLSL
jgi:hypothetical protein